MQHDLFVHPNSRMWASYPLVVVLPADIAEGDGRIVAPLSRSITQPSSRMRPLIRHDGDQFILMMRLLGLLPVRLFLGI
jgi:hypothetical protein